MRCRNLRGTGAAGACRRPRRPSSPARSAGCPAAERGRRSAGRRAGDPRRAPGPPSRCRVRPWPGWSGRSPRRRSRHRRPPGPALPAAQRGCRWSAGPWGRPGPGERPRSPGPRSPSPRARPPSARSGPEASAGDMAVSLPVTSPRGGASPGRRRPRLLVLASTLPATPGDGTPGFVADLARIEATAFDTVVVAPAVPGARARETLGRVRRSGASGSSRGGGRTSPPARSWRTSAPGRPLAAGAVVLPGRRAGGAPSGPRERPGRGPCALDHPTGPDGPRSARGGCRGSSRRWAATSTP